MRRAPRRPILAAAVAVLVAASLALAGCSSSDGIAGPGTDKGGDYTSGDGATTTFAQKNRSAPVSWTATEADGSTLTSKELLGKVVVLNFWYAQCGPCIAEAPRLEKLSTAFGDQVQFVGVNVRDNPDQAKAFAAAHRLTYPTTIEQDGHEAPITVAFTGKVSTTTTPTTLVIDKEGRVAARFSGEITPDQQSVLREVIQTTLDETS